MSDNALPSFAAPPDAQLTDDMLAAFHDAGVLILRDFVSAEECQALRSRALELLDDFDPDEVHSVFSTTKQTQLDDSYFIESGDKIRFFLEDNAFNESGQLRQSKEESLNKIGHALHDLDPVEIGLGDLGKHDSYVARQLKTWYRSWTSSIEGADFDDPSVFHRTVGLRDEWANIQKRANKPK